MSLTTASLFVVLGLILLFAGGEWMVRGSARLASRLGVSPLIIGLTVVAFGTSSPELAVSVSAAVTGHNDVAIGNVVGSNICNIALILGLAAVIRPIQIKARLFKTDLPIMIACTVLLLFMLDNRMVGRLEGVALVFGIVLYLGHEIWDSRRESREVQDEFESAAPRPGIRRRSLALIVTGIALLVLGAKLFVDGAVTVGLALGFSPTLVALTIVALGTSLPELATSVVASARGQGDIAIGNVIGSNIFNMLAILGITAVVTPLSGKDVILPDLVVFAGLSTVLLPVFYSDLRLSRLEGALLLVVYVVYLVWRVSAAV